jgi:hypothetical protein
MSFRILKVEKNIMEKKDALAAFIKTNANSFDDLKAPPQVWQRISEKTKSAPVHSLWKWSAVAASALLLIVAGYLFGIKAHAKPDIAGWDEYLEAEQFYQVRINQQMEKIKKFPVGQEVMNDIQLLDEVYMDLRTQLLEDPNANTELLLSAMIKHQQQKLGVMEKILQRVNKYQTNENENHEM